MPVKPQQIDGRWRVVEASTGVIATNPSKTAVDGGGHLLRESAVAQCRAINASIAKKKRGKR
jgi:hypothetical protein